MRGMMEGEGSKTPRGMCAFATRPAKVHCVRCSIVLLPSAVCGGRRNTLRMQYINAAMRHMERDTISIVNIIYKFQFHSIISSGQVRRRNISLHT